MYSQNFSSLNELNVSLAERAKKTKKQTNEKKIIVIIEQNFASRKGMQEIFACEIWNPANFCCESGILGSEESGIPLTISIRDPVREIQSLAFPYVGRKTYDTQLKRKQLIKADSHFQLLQSHLIHRQP